MMTSEEKRKLWMDAFHAEMRSMRKYIDSGEVNNDEAANGCREWADIIVAHASRLMPDFAEPELEREFDRGELINLLDAKLNMNEYYVPCQAAIDIIDGKIPGVKYTPPTTTNMEQP